VNIEIDLASTWGFIDWRRRRVAAVPVISHAPRVLFVDLVVQLTDAFESISRETLCGPTRALETSDSVTAVGVSAATAVVYCALVYICTHIVTRSLRQ